MTCARPVPLHALAYFADSVEGRRGEILDAALVVFGEKGYEAGTMREIAAQVGVSEPAIYRHYASKEALLVDLVATAAEQMIAEVARRLDAVQPETLRASLRELIHRRRQDVADDRNIMPALMDIAPHNDIARETFQKHFGRPMVRNISSLLPRIDDYFAIRRTPDQLNSKVRAFMSLFIGYQMTAGFFDRPIDDDAIIDAMLAVMGWDAPEPSPTS